jgi:Holliday junction resolvasome RuvABC endonuclease subunit
MEFAAPGMSDVLNAAQSKKSVSGRVMGLDLSLTASGIEILDYDGERAYGCVVGYSLKKATDESRVKRLISMVEEIIGLVGEYEVKHVAVEDYAYGSRYGREKLAELHGIIKVELYRKFGIVVEPVPPKRARMVVFGKGKGGIKKVQVRPLLERYGIYIDDGDRRDAYVVARYMLWRVTHGERHERHVGKRKRRRKNTVR